MRGFSCLGCCTDLPEGLGVCALRMFVLLELTSCGVEAPHPTVGAVALVERRRPGYTHEVKRCKHTDAPPPEKHNNPGPGLVLLSSYFPASRVHTHALNTGPTSVQSVLSWAGGSERLWGWPLSREIFLGS